MFVPSQQESYRVCVPVILPFDRYDFYCRHKLIEFYSSIIADNRINGRHISLYTALFECWNENHFKNLINFTRHTIMPISQNKWYRDLSQMHKGIT
jgi:hypothetical protein